MNLKIPHYDFKLPWFIFDLSNLQLITSITIPIGDISDVKSIVFAETPIPGINFAPVNVGGMGNRKISFTLPLVKKNNTVGNLLLLKQFENLRNQSFGLNLASIFRKEAQFIPNPKVLYFWGTSNAVPLEYYVTKCDFNHRSAFVNQVGMTQYSEVQLELLLDETSILYKAEETARKISSIVSSFDQAFNIQRNTKLGGSFA